MTNFTNSEIKKLKKVFYQIYHEKIYTILTEIEQKRKNTLSTLFYIELVLIGAFFIVCFLSSLIILRAILLSIIIFCIIYLPILYNNEFSKKVKLSVKKDILSALKSVTSIEWEQDKTILPKEELERSELFATFDTLEVDDMFTGDYKNIKYAIQECRLRQTKNGYWTIFNGVVIKFQSNKTINGKTIITNKKDFCNQNRNIGIIWVRLAFLLLALLICTPLINYSIEQWTVYGKVELTGIIMIITIFILGIVAIIWNIINFLKICTNDFENLTFIKNIRKTNVEDVNFNQKFITKTTDEIEARYIMTTTFIENLTNMQLTFNTTDIKCALQNNTVTFAISTKKNLFEIGSLFHSLTQENTMEEFFNELVSILLLIDYFKFDRKTGL